MTAEPISPQKFSVRLHINEIKPFYVALVFVLNELGVPRERLEEILSKHISADCMQCGILLTPLELNELALEDSPANLGQGKVDRLRQGYCGRKDCNSYFYRMSFNAVEGVDWAAVKEKVQQKLSAPPAQETVEQKTARKQRFAFPLRFKLGLVTIVILLLVKWVMWNGSIPILQKKTTYTIQPSPFKTENSE
jgi:hypothetical protein